MTTAHERTYGLSTRLNRHASVSFAQFWLSTKVYCGCGGSYARRMNPVSVLSRPLSIGELRLLGRLPNEARRAEIEAEDREQGEVLGERVASPLPTS